MPELPGKSSSNLTVQILMEHIGCVLHWPLHMVRSYKYETLFIFYFTDHDLSLRGFGVWDSLGSNSIFF